MFNTNLLLLSYEFGNVRLFSIRLGPLSRPQRVKHPESDRISARPDVELHKGMEKYEDRTHGGALLIIIS